MYFIKSQTGNALFLIFIAVALFAALSYAVTNSGSSGGGKDKEQAEISAARIFNHLASVNSVIQRKAILSSVGDNYLDFDTVNRLRANGTSIDYDNTLCTDSVCEVYNTQEGGVAYQSFEDVSLAMGDDWPSGLMPGHSIPTIAKVEGVGSDQPEIVLRYIGIKEDVCIAINRRMGLPDEPQQTIYSETGYVMNGDPTPKFAATNMYWFGDDFADLIGARTFCTVWTTAPKVWNLWHVVKER